jgi:hypothetical protein
VQGRLVAFHLHFHFHRIRAGKDLQNPLPYVKIMG